MRAATPTKPRRGSPPADGLAREDRPCGSSGRDDLHLAEAPHRLPGHDAAGRGAGSARRRQASEPPGNTRRAPTADRARPSGHGGICGPGDPGQRGARRSGRRIEPTRALSVVHSPAKTESPMSHSFNPTSLREYDIRGVVGRTLGEDDAEALGRSFGTLVRRRGGPSEVAVGRDGRESSPALEQALIRGLTTSGADVVRVGVGPTPMLYYAEAVLDVGGGIMITGSHNPPEYNGFKMVLGHGAFFGEAIQQAGRMAAAGDWEQGQGSVRDEEVLERYVDRLLECFDG